MLHSRKQDRLVIVVFVETQLGDVPIKALAVVAQILDVALKHMGSGGRAVTEQRLGCQVHLINRAFKRGVKIVLKQHGDAAGIPASLRVALARTLDVLRA